MKPEHGGRRGLGACCAGALASVVLPGLGHVVIQTRLRTVVVVAAAFNIVATIAVAIIVGGVDGRSDLAEVIADRTVFLGLAASLLVLALTRLWSALDAAWLARPVDHSWRPAAAAVIACAVVIGGVAPLAVAADYVWETDRAVERVFSSGDAVTANPSPLTTTTSDPSTGTTTTITTTTSGHTTSTTNVATATTDSTTSTTNTTTTTTSTTVATTTTAPAFPGEDRVNVLLLGGDAGPDRWSMRTDSMIVVSIDPDTGDTAMISVPRNLRRLPFPPGTTLAERYPKGFEEIANAVYTRVDSHRELAGGGDDAGAQAIKMGIAQLLGIPIHYYVLVDMAGFVDVVDALGGIDIDVLKRVPSVAKRPDEKHPVPRWFEKGPQHMDGTVALAYARTRSADSDYGRMARQRCVLAGIAAAATPRALAFGLTDLVAAFGAAVRSDIPRERLGEVAQLVDRYSQAGGQDAVRTLQLTPPVIDPADWDPVEVRQLVADLLAGTHTDSAPPSLGAQCA